MSDKAELHSCGPRRTTPVGSKVARLPYRTIDLHCHILTPTVEELVSTQPEFSSYADEQARALGARSASVSKAQFGSLLPKLTGVSERLADMDNMGVDIQVISPSPTQYHYWAREELSDEIARLQNERIEAICGDHPDRFRALGTVSLQHPRLAAEQLESLIRRKGFVGVEIGSQIGGRDIADDHFDPFWKMADQLGALVFIHPWGTTMGTRLADHYLMNTIGQPLETTICLSKLIFSGRLDRHPKVRIVAAHGGGYLPAYIGRSDHAYHARPEVDGCACQPSDYLRRIWYDCIVHDPGQLRVLVDRVGADRVLLGSDYPFDMGEYDFASLLADFSDEEIQSISGGNAERLLAIYSIRLNEPDP